MNLDGAAGTTIGSNASAEQSPDMRGIICFAEANGRKEHRGFSIFKVGMNTLKHLGDAILKTVWLPLLELAT